MTVIKNRISVVGLGFVGLSLAIANARMGFDTIGVDIDNKKINNLQTGCPDFFEPGMGAMLIDVIKREKIYFTIDLDHAIRNTDITFLTVGTPSKGNGDIDLSYVKDAIERIALSLEDKKSFHVLVVKSTLPPLTTESLILPTFKDMIERERVDVVVNPEFLREGFAISDLLKPHLIVIGSNGGQGSRILEEYYQDFHGVPPEIMHTNIPTAEMIKYANNAFLATKISFINSIGTLCQGISGGDVDMVARAIGKDPRIGSQFLQAGPGFGGSCLPKDLAGLIRFSQKIEGRFDLFRAVKEVNDRQFMTVIEMMKAQGVLVEGNTVAVLGLAFKGGTDDIREAVSIKVVKNLLRYRLNIKVHDPMALKNFERIFGTSITYCISINECLQGSDCCVILTDWDEYRGLKPHDFIKITGSCNVIDTRRVLNAKEFEGTGFRAIGLGT